jgi:hypothetical protein
MARMDRSHERLVGEEGILYSAQDKSEMAMCSIAEIRVDLLGFGLKLVAEFVERLRSGLAVYLGEFGKLEIGLPVIDTVCTMRLLTNSWCFEIVVRLV